MVCIEVHMFGLSSVHMYSDRTWGFQVTVNGPNIILYYITKCRGWEWQPPTIELSDHELIIVIKKKEK